MGKVIWEQEDRAGFMDIQAVLSHGAYAKKDTAQGKTLCIYMMSYISYRWWEGCCCSATQLCLSLCDPMDCSTPGFSILHHLLELAQTHVCWVRDAILPTYPLPSPSPPALNLSQHQGLFQTNLFKRKLIFRTNTFTLNGNTSRYYEADPHFQICCLKHCSPCLR